MLKAMQETERRRKIQMEYNEKHHITPQPIGRKTEANSILAFLDISRRLNAQQLEEIAEKVGEISLEQIPELIEQLEAKMKEAAKNLEFEEAAKYRDRIQNLRDKLLGRK
jgi:excinuclease ABC subunit B